jgi:hypothetical protein
MKAFVCFWIFALISLAAKSQVVWENKYGIVPLRSTRADVKRLYGSSQDSCECIFPGTDSTLKVTYATAPCSGPVYGWNVPKDTVVEFRVIPKTPISFSQQALDRNNFVKRYSPEDITIYYTNVKSGVMFSVQDNHVISIVFFPTDKDKGLRCPGFPSYDGVPPPTSEGTIFDRNKINVEARLDNLAIQLLANKKIRGYVVTYAGKISCRGEGEQMAEEARRYLMEKRGVPADQIIGIDGGFRETSQYDLFILDLEMPPPTPTPTVASNEVKYVGQHK